MRAKLRIFCVAIPAFFLQLGTPGQVAAVDFAAAKSYAVGTSPAGIAVGDFNGDGNLDIAVANAGSSNVSILLGNGDGTFQAAANFSAGNNPMTVAVGDFDGDGKLDLALFQPGDLSLSRGGSVSILLGNGDGTFQAPKTLALGPAATIIAVADFNLDKKSDLAVFNTASVGIYLGNGDGTFQPVIDVSTPAADGHAMVAADFNGDSNPDLAVTFSFNTNPGGSAGLHILLGNGDGTFSPGVTLDISQSLGLVTVPSVLAADLNQDGKADLLMSSFEEGLHCRYSTCTLTSISVFLGNGDGSFMGRQIVASAEVTTPPYSSKPIDGDRIDRPILGDFNGDGKLDLVYRITHFSSGNVTSSSLDIRLGKGDGTFCTLVLSGLQSVDPFANSIAVAQDLNPDKLTDLVALGTTNDIDVLLNTSPTTGADLDIRSAGPSGGTVGVGTNLTYTADVLNLGPQDATGVTFTDTLPNSVSFVSATASQGSCVQASGIVTCNVGTLASPFEFTVNIVVTPTVAGTLTNTMNVTANETDPNPSNNNATATTTVVPMFKLIATKTGTGSGTVTTPDGGINCGSTCTAMYLSGTGLQVNETPDVTSLFTGWSGACTGTGACAITLSADTMVAANFVLGEKLSVAMAGSGSGSVTSKDGGINCSNSVGNCSALYAPGTSVSLKASPAAPSVFGGWGGACTGTDPNVCSVTMNSGQSVTATFTPPPPDFTLAPAFTTLTLQTGAQVTDPLTLSGQNGFSGPVTLTCAVTGPAPMATCSVSPSTVTLGSNPGSSTLTMRAPTILGAAVLPLNEGNLNEAYAVVLPFPALLLGAIGLASQNFKKRRRSLWLRGGSVIILFVVLGVLAGCGGGSTQHLPQEYTVTVTAASGSLKHSTAVTLNVQ